MQLPFNKKEIIVLGFLVGAVLIGFCLPHEIKSPDKRPILDSLVVEKQDVEESNLSSNTDSNKSKREANSEPETQNFPIDLNTANQKELEALDGIGPSKACCIIEYRKKIGRFSSVEQLTNVKGIGPKTLEKNRSKIFVK